MSELTNPDFLTQLQEFFSRHTMMVGAWVSVFLFLIIVQFRLLTARVKKDTIGVAVNKVNHQDGIFVDVRSQDKFSQGHIANAINMTLSEIKSGQINRIERRKDVPVILVGKDKYDTEAFNAARILKKFGFNGVTTLEGGMLEWYNNNLPVTNKK